MDYSLDVVSGSPETQGKTLRKHKIEGIETIGALHNEPFEVRFTNHTWFKVQVKITLDGIDIMTGELATSEPTTEMWVVQPNSVLAVRAFPETDQGGRAFVFSHAGNSVAVHTTGDLSHRGIIAAAVFTEGAPEPLRLAPIAVRDLLVPYWWNGYGWNPYDYRNDQLTWTYIGNTNAGGYVGGGTYTCSGTTALSGDVCGAYSTVNSMQPTVQDQQSLPAVGAGQYVEQEINHSAGLNKPLLAKTLQMRYLWWDDLESKLSNQVAASAHPSGFPADTKKRINLQNVPTIPICANAPLKFQIETSKVEAPQTQPFRRVEP